MALATACGDDEPTAPVVRALGSIEIVSGEAQSGIAGSLLGDSLVVRVLDGDSVPFDGQAVTFGVTSGGGSVATASVTADAAGVVRSAWTLGPSVASVHRVTAQSRDPVSGQVLSVTFDATALAGPAMAVMKVSGDDQSALADSTLTDSVVVRVEDANGNPVEGATVTWTTGIGGGTTEDSVSVSDSTGLVSTRWTVGPDATAQQTLLAALDSTDETWFRAWACMQLWPAGPGCFYPRQNAPSVADAFASPPALPAVSATGTPIGVLDMTGRGTSDYGETLAGLRTFEPLGIPGETFTGVDRLRDFEIVLLPGVMSMGDFTTAELDSLEAFAQSGGTLLLFNVADPAAYALAGVTDARYDNSHAQLLFSPGPDPVFAYLDHPNELTTIISDGGTVGVPSREYDCTGTVLATYDNAEHAICRRDAGTGAVYTFGLRPKMWQLFRQDGRTGGVELGYTNHFDPTADLPTLMLRGLYEAVASSPQLRTFVPAGYDGVLIVTHDIDASSSVANIEAYMTFERQEGIGATYLMQTPGQSTGWTSGFYTPDAVEVLRGGLGDFDFGSHSFGHFPDFDLCDAGTGLESAAHYGPRYTSNVAFGCTIYGEAGVSRYMLREDLGVGIDHYRSGYLLQPDGLYPVLEELGYARASNVPGGMTGAVFPYVAFEYDNSVVTEYRLMEYPITISDTGLDDTNVDQKVQDWIAVLQANAANDMPTVYLLHPSSRPGRSEAFQQFITTVNDGTYWITDLGSFSDFWESQGVVSAGR